MSRSIEALVEPAVLRWARTSGGWDRATVAKWLDIDVKTLDAWESGDVGESRKRLTVARVRDLAAHYKRPLAAFFLPEPPDERPTPPDFRAGTVRSEPPRTPDMLLAVRRATWLCELARDLRADLEQPQPPSLPRARLGDDADRLAAELRGTLGIDLAVQAAWESAGEAYREWKRAIEAIDVLVFQYSLAPEDVGGFSVNVDGSRAIAVTTRDPPSRRCFTLFHELGHLMLGSSGICNEGPDSNGHGRQRSDVESFCHRVAAATLVPIEDLLARVSSSDRADLATDRTLSRLATTYSVSREVMLRRLHEAELVPPTTYRSRMSELVAISRSRAKTPSGTPPKIPAHRKCVSAVGKRMITLIMEGERTGAITRSEALAALGIGESHFERVQQVVGFE